MSNPSDFLKLHLSKTIAKTKEILLFYFPGLINHIDKHNDFLLAGGLAFSLFVCIIPLVLMLFSLLGLLLENATIQAQVNTFIYTIIPYESTAADIQRIISDRIHQFKEFKSIAGYLGAIGLLFAASGLFTSLRDILHIIFHIRSRKSVFHAKLRDMGMVFIALLVFVFSMAVLPLLEIIKNLLNKIYLLHFLQNNFLSNVIFSFFSFILIFLLFGIVYYLIPQEKLPIKVVWISAFWAAFLWEIAKKLFGFYLSHLASLDQIYGAYVFLIIAAFWIYYSSIVLIIGAEIGQLFRERKKVAKSHEE